MKGLGASNLDDRLTLFTQDLTAAASQALKRRRFIIASSFIIIGLISLLWPPLSLGFIALFISYSVVLAPAALVSYHPLAATYQQSARRRPLAITLILTLALCAPLAWWLTFHIHTWFAWVPAVGVAVAGFIRLITAQRAPRPLLPLGIGFLLLALGFVLLVYQPWVTTHIREFTSALIIGFGLALIMWKSLSKETP